LVAVVAFFAGEPGLVVVGAGLGGETQKAIAVGADKVDGDDLVGVGPVFTISPVALAASLVEQEPAHGGPVPVDRERILRRLQAEEVSLDVLEGGFLLGEGGG